MIVSEACCCGIMPEIHISEKRGRTVMKNRSIRIGVDVGGTNTDICAIDEKSGQLMVYKLPSSLHDQSAAVVYEILYALQREGRLNMESRRVEGACEGIDAPKFYLTLK